MLWAGPEQAEVFLGESVVGWCLPGATPAWWDADAPEGAWDTAQRALAAAAPARSRWRVRVSLSARVAVPLLVPAVEGLGNAREALGLAQALCADATGNSEPHRIWLQQWKPGYPCLAVAVRQSLLDHVESDALAARLRLCRIEPWWSTAFNAARALHGGAGMFAIDDGDGLAMLTAGASGFTRAWSQPSADPDQLTSIVARERLWNEDGTDAGAVQVRRDDGTQRTSGDARLDLAFGARWERLS